ncbi:MAG: hypothetical protein JRE57_00140 [Deltaproteobacteria bacterium]|nr:hypothetical protein [Deltaproteobacteria bacterium]
MALPVREFIIQRLLEYDPSFDVGSGVPTTSLFIDPLSVVLQPVVDELTVVQATQSILTILESSDPNSFPEDIVDGLASNALVERNPGSIGSDVERIRFFEPQAFSAQIGVLIFLGGGGQRYTNSESIAITSAEMSLNQEGNLYYIDIPIVALEEGDDFNVDAGAITSMEAEPVGVANLTNRFGVSQGASRETNTELIDRMKVAVTVRALVTGRGIVVTLTENFTTIEEIQPIGFGKDEMMRDIVHNVHIGGNVDVYIKTPSFTEADYDVFGLEVDFDRTKAGSATVVAVVQDVGYNLGKSNLDRTNVSPLVKTIDGVFVYSEGTDYTIDDTFGLISRIALSNILHEVGSAATVTGLKNLMLAGGFVNARPGMVLTVDTPATVAGTYTIKAKVDDDNVTIYGEFPVASETGVGFNMDDALSVTFEYNPIAVDVIKTVRTGREDFTITNVPLMRITSVEVLDPLSGEPTGTVLDDLGGYGAGPYGAGGFGIGDGPDYKLVVDEPTLRHSELEDNYIEFQESLVGLSVRITYEYASAIPPIQAFMDDENNQNQSASLLARSFIPVFVDSLQSITYDINTADEATALSVAAMTTLVETFIDDVDQGDDLELSDIVDVLYDNGAVRVDLGALNSLRGEIHNHNGAVVFTLPDSTGSMPIPNDPIPDPTDKPLSPRIARFRARTITLARQTV